MSYLQYLDATIAQTVSAQKCLKYPYIERDALLVMQRSAARFARTASRACRDAAWGEPPGGSEELRRGFGLGRQQ